MTATREVTIWCDGPSCYDWEPTETGNMIEARRIVAKERGWIQSQTRTRFDYCPKCQEKLGLK